MYLARIAFRNLFRRRGRNFMIAAILTLAVLIFLLLESFMIGTMNMSFANIIDFETPHIEIGRKDFFEEAAEGRELPIDETFIAGEDMLQEVRESPGFVALTGVLDFNADFIAGRHQFPVRVRAVDMETFGEVFRNQEYMESGEFIEPGGDGVVIGDQLARYFGLEVGDYYTLRFRDKGGSFNTMQGEVRGIVNTPHPDMNLGTVFVSRDKAALALGLEEEKISQVMVRMDSRDRAPTQAERLQEKVGAGDISVRSYRDGAELLVYLETWGLTETYFILALFLMVGAIGIISVVVLSGIERVKEIGMMKAMGLKESDIVRVFALEAGCIGALGGLVGCLLGALGNIWLVVRGIKLEEFFDLAELGAPVADKVYGTWNMGSFFLIFVFVIFLAMLASLLPSYWAARKDPVEAIRER